MRNTNFLIMSDFQAFLAPIRDMQLDLVESIRPVISLDAFRELIQAVSSVFMRKGTLTLTRLVICEYFTHLQSLNGASNIGWKCKGPDPPIQRRLPVANTKKEYQGSNGWTLYLIVYLPLDHFFLDALPSFGLPLHVLETLRLKVPHISTNLVTRINNVLCHVPALKSLTIHFAKDKARCTSCLQIPISSAVSYVCRRVRK